MRIRIHDGSNCPICGNKVKEIGEKIISVRDGKTRTVGNFLCPGCDFQGTSREFRQKANENIIDDRIAFYYCKELHLGLYYRERSPQTDPLKEVIVDIPRLNDREVGVKFVGLGELGQAALKNLVGHNAPIFPVDLWHDPGCIDPHVSNTVSESLYNKWEEFVKVAK